MPNFDYFKRVRKIKCRLVKYNFKNTRKNNTRDNHPQSHVEEMFTLQFQTFCTPVHNIQSEQHSKCYPHAPDLNRKRSKQNCFPFKIWNHKIYFAASALLGGFHSSIACIIPSTVSTI